jgi:mono/diheme cytochrome c family protein
VLIALTIAGGSAPGAISGANISKNPAINALPGSQLIADAACATCHAFPTGGASGPGSSLANGSARFTTNQKQLADWIGHGASQSGTGMPAFDQSFNQQQIDQIAQVIASLKTNSVQPLGGS